MDLLAGFIANISEKTEENALMAQQAATLAENIRTGAEMSTTQMVQAVQEVRSLAARSTASPKDTTTLVENSLDKTALGVSLAQETSASLAAILSDIGESERLVHGIAATSQEMSSQSEALKVLTQRFKTEDGPGRPAIGPGHY